MSDAKYIVVRINHPVCQVDNAHCVMKDDCTSQCFTYENKRDLKEYVIFLRPADAALLALKSHPRLCHD